MFDYSYSSLFACLHAISNTQSNPFLETPAAIPFQYAWSIVDSLNRLRVLLRHMPGHKAASLPEREIFLRNTEVVEDLRNSIQHLDGEISALVAANEPIWGSITWFASHDETRVTGCSCVLVAGSIFEKENYQVVNPCGRLLTYPVGLITLSATGKQLNISDATDEAGRLLLGLERELNKEFGESPTGGADLLVKIEMRFDI